MPIRHLGNNESAVECIRTNYHLKIAPIILQNNYKTVCFFDNEDYDYDPNTYISYPNKNLFFFKRNYSKHQVYFKNVISFPFIMFGPNNIMERIDRQMVTESDYIMPKQERVFFTGGLYIHECKPFNVYVNRRDMYNKISSTIFNPGSMQNQEFINAIQQSKFSLDLHGAGNPNIRTFEILLSGSLVLQQKNDLVWPFESPILEECIFENAEEYFIKLDYLMKHDDVYNKCLAHQYAIVNKYFNKAWLRNYILHLLTFQMPTQRVGIYSEAVNVIR
jgi:hypothetical protein